jgi:hypothetical protein
MQCWLTFDPPQFRKDYAQLAIARRALRGVLFNLDLEPGQTQVDTLLSMIDHFYDHPETYKEIIYDSI